MKEIVRNISRRKLRSFLTVSGIVIGIVALTTMGALANNFNALLDGGAKYYAGYVPVGDATSNGVTAGGIVPLAKADEIAAVAGVARVFPTITVQAKPGALNVVNISLPDYIASQDPAENGYSALRLSFASGRDLDPTAGGQIVLGSNFAAEFGKRVGDTVMLPVKPADAGADFVQHAYTVVGILNRTLTAPDTGAFVSLADAQQLLKEQLPASLQAGFNAAMYAAGFNVYGTPGTNLDQLADRINAQVSGVKAQRPSKIVAALVAGGRLFTEITTAAALLALVIGGLAVINTMIMAVSERVREIGLKKAVGATTGAVTREFLLESSLIGLTGGVMGFGLGFGITSLINATAPAAQGPIFLVTPGLAALCVGFALALGAVAGILPALRAARLDPVAALRAS
ncbi:MAG TPA: FtsX-like permease family protein [Candidatus Dormibacteraeota bacterium]|nr:FtsX-like permease family protein [Candidatus Dormibacteraeota bacterium]